MTEPERAVAQCLTTVATLTVVHDRAHHAHVQVRGQLEQALESRVVIEQAKGYLARGNDETTNQAFVRLRRHARGRGRRLTAVAEDVLARRLDVDLN